MVAAIRCGAVAAMVMVTSPPREVPTKIACAMPCWSSSSTTSAA
jgi:hypothetical protein